VKRRGEEGRKYKSYRITLFSPDFGKLDFLLQVGEKVKGEGMTDSFTL
jgi:hypothetical protein